MKKTQTNNIHGLCIHELDANVLLTSMSSSSSSSYSSRNLVIIVVVKEKKALNLYFLKESKGVLMELNTRFKGRSINLFIFQKKGTHM